ncbi:hypothetical protein [Streptomyces sp. NPDC054940]
MEARSPEASEGPEGAVASAAAGEVAVEGVADVERTGAPGPAVAGVKGVVGRWAGDAGVGAAEARLSRDVRVVGAGWVLWAGDASRAGWMPPAAVAAGAGPSAWAAAVPRAARAPRAADVPSTAPLSLALNTAPSTDSRTSASTTPADVSRTARDTRAAQCPQDSRCFSRDQASGSGREPFA